MFKSITIRNFKSIACLDNFKLTNLNILIGANGSGKSNFIEMFRFLRAFFCLSNPEIPYASLGMYVGYYGGSDLFLFHGAEKIDIELNFQQHSYQLALIPDSQNRFVAQCERQRSRSNWQLLSSKFASESALVRNNRKSSTSQRIYDAISSTAIYHFHDTTGTSGMRRFSDIADKKNLRFDGSNIASYLFYLKCDHPLCYEKIRQYIQLIAPFFDDFILENGTELSEQTRMLWRHKGSDYTSKPIHLSDGTIRFICLATALLQPNLPSLIIIDEPELGLHPFVINVLAELIKSASQKTQVIIATQSPRLIDNFSANDIITVNRKNGKSIFERLDENNFKDWLEDYSLGELWVKNVIEASKAYNEYEE